MFLLKVIEFREEDSRVAYMTRYYTEVMIPCHWGHNSLLICHSRL